MLRSTLKFAKGAVLGATTTYFLDPGTRPSPQGHTYTASS